MGDLESIHDGHAEIEDDYLRIVSLYDIQRRNTAVHCLRIMTIRPQQHRQAVGPVCIVVYNQHT